MSRKVAVIFVHGILADSNRYAEPMQRALLGKLPRSLRKEVDFRTVFWATEVRDRQRTFMQRALAETNISDNEMRRFVLQGLGDAEDRKPSTRCLLPNPGFLTRRAG